MGTIERVKECQDLGSKHKRDSEREREIKRGCGSKRGRVIGLEIKRESKMKGIRAKDRKYVLRIFSIKESKVCIQLSLSIYKESTDEIRPSPQAKWRKTTFLNGMNNVQNRGPKQLRQKKESSSKRLTNKKNYTCVSSWVASFRLLQDRGKVLLL